MKPDAPHQRHQVERPAIHSVLWDEICIEVAAQYPEIPWRSMLVDALAALMVLHPERLT